MIFPCFIELLIREGAKVNAVDHKGVTPLSWLVLHVNRSLRYHIFDCPDLQTPDRAAAERATVPIDSEYQQQVHKVKIEYPYTIHNK